VTVAVIRSDSSVEVGRERLERLFPARASRADVPAAVVTQLADCQVEDFEGGLLGRDWPRLQVTFRSRALTDSIRFAACRPAALVVVHRRWQCGAARPADLARARTYPNDPSMRPSTEATYQGLFTGRLGKKQGKLRTGRLVRRRQRRGVAPPNKIKNMRLIQHRPAESSRLCDRRPLGGRSDRRRQDDRRYRD
jgi:hypothetical protein